MDSNANRQERIEQHRAEMPQRYRETYDRAMTGRSRKSAMRVFCAECCGYEIREVHCCSSPECPLFPYRPRSRAPQGAPEGLREAVESTDAREKVSE